MRFVHVRFEIRNQSLKWALEPTLASRGRLQLDRKRNLCNSFIIARCHAPFQYWCNVLHMGEPLLSTCAGTFTLATLFITSETLAKLKHSAVQLSGVDESKHQTRLHALSLILVFYARMHWLFCLLRSHCKDENQLV